MPHTNSSFQDLAPLAAGAAQPVQAVVSLLEPAPEDEMEAMVDALLLEAALATGEVPVRRRLFSNRKSFSVEASHSFLESLIEHPSIGSAVMDKGF